MFPVLCTLSVIHPQFFPAHPALLSVFVAAEQRGHLASRLRRHFDTVIDSTLSGTLRVFAVWINELQQDIQVSLNVYVNAWHRLLSVLVFLVIIFLSFKSISMHILITRPRQRRPVPAAVLLCDRL
jgi:hypothetical protein